MFLVYFISVFRSSRVGGGVLGVRAFVRRIVF